MSYLIVMLALATTFLWTMLVTADERQWVHNNVCPVKQTIIRYPARLGGPHPAVCQPTGIVWR